LEILFFTLGLVNSVLLISIFLVRKRGLVLVRRFGWLYLLLSFPAAYGIILAQQEQESARYSIFLVIFLAFLAMEWVFDHLLKIDFRTNLKKNWKLATPYLCFYYAMNYGFIVMPWKASPTWGGVMLGLFIIQMAANLSSHPKSV
jgi:hypothetical protein